jgi:pimeloyl-ACP methyl ester carboxylesterase
MIPPRRTRSAVVVLALAAVAMACSSASPSSPSTSAPDLSTPSTTNGSGLRSPTSSNAPAPVAVPTLAWTSCPPPPAGDASVDGFACASAVVPMDYAAPSGDTFTLAVIKHPAEEPAHRIGTLFWNVGGPGDVGTEFLPAAIQGFPEAVRRRFDIVSWDPRGMGGRTTPAVQCFDSAEEEERFFADHPIATIPFTPSELAQANEALTAFNAACVERNADLLAHVSTADNARDLDLLRQAVGDEQMTYYGTSYGTFLGATYINMFPDRVRAAVLDGAIFPTAWAGGGGTEPALSTFVRTGSDLGSAETVQEFINQCSLVEAGSCAFSAGSPEATQAKWAELLERTAATPVTLKGEPISADTILSYVQSSLYTIRPLPGFGGRFPGWVAVAEFLETVWQATEAGGAAPSTTASPPPASRATTAAAGASTYVTSAGRPLAVICGESPNPTTAAAYSAQALASYARAGRNVWPWLAYCAGWTIKAADPYLGPWNRPTPVPVLVIGNTFDPATPYSGSQRAAEELADGHLLTVEGFGHTELINPSRCAQHHVAVYLIAGTLPPDGTVCPQDGAPFAQP